MVRKFVVAHYGDFAESMFTWELVKYPRNERGGRRDSVMWRRCIHKRPEFRGRDRRAKSMRVFRGLVEKR